MEQHYFKTAEFAALCGVKKDTLLHYDHIGLLKPERVGENGYRYYSVRQLPVYDLIAALRRLDMPLGEIRDYLNRRSPETLLALLREKEAALVEERRRLERMQGLLREMVQATQLSQRVRSGEIRLEECPAEYCAVVRAPKFDYFEEPIYLLHIRDLLTWAREHGNTILAPGDIVRRESLERDSFLEDYYYCKVPEGVEGWQTIKKPAGIYAVLYHQGTYESESEACRKLRDWVWEQNYEIDGDLYQEDLINDLTSDDPRRYLLRLSLKIRAGEGEKLDALSKEESGSSL